MLLEYPISTEDLKGERTVGTRDRQWDSMDHVLAM